MIFIVNLRDLSNGLAFLLVASIILVAILSAFVGVFAVGVAIHASLSTPYAPITLASLTALLAVPVIKPWIFRIGLLLLAVVGLGGAVKVGYERSLTFDWVVTEDLYQEWRKQGAGLTNWRHQPDLMFFWQQAEQILVMDSTLQKNAPEQHASWRQAIEPELAETVFTHVIDRERFWAGEGHDEFETLAGLRSLESALASMGQPRLASFNMACFADDKNRLTSVQRAQCAEPAAVKAAFGVDLKSFIDTEYAELRGLLGALLANGSDGAGKAYAYPACTGSQSVADPRLRLTARFGADWPDRCPCPHMEASAKMGGRTFYRCNPLPPEKLRSDPIVRQVLAHATLATLIAARDTDPNAPDLFNMVCPLLPTCQDLDRRGIMPLHALRQAWRSGT